MPLWGSVTDAGTWAIRAQGGDTEPRVGEAEEVSQRQKAGKQCSRQRTDNMKPGSSVSRELRSRTKSPEPLYHFFEEKRKQEMRLEV